MKRINLKTSAINGLIRDYEEFINSLSDGSVDDYNLAMLDKAICGLIKHILKYEYKS